MTRSLNLDDIQGNVIRAYGRYSFPFARYFFLNISDCGKGRQFIEAVRQKVTTGATWPEGGKPPVTMNIGFTFLGLLKMQIPERTLRGMPEDFISGMKNRAFILGDRDVTKTEAESVGWDKHWDPIWQGNRVGDGDDTDNVHIWISMNAQLHTLGQDEPVAELEEQTQWLRDLCKDLDQGVRILTNNGKNGDQEYQASSAVFQEKNGVKLPTPKEHFGFSDGIGDPVYKGQYAPELEKTAVIGRGKRMSPEAGWEPIEAGEFILGHPDESQELPPAAAPPEFTRNSTFMAYRKLHENVGTFDEVMREEAKTFAAHQGVSEIEARETLHAKMCGRWSDGVPISVVPTYEEWIAFGDKMGFNDADPVKALENQVAYLRSPASSDFVYADDMLGYKNPVGSHLRRMNTRDYLDPLNKIGIDPETGQQHKNENATSALNKRRRILRRGLPYGPRVGEAKTDDTEQGVTMIIMCASLSRQFEFVQQQWIQYGLDFHQGNDTCPMLGNHDRHKRFTITSDPKSGKNPYVMSKLKTFVECRGGDYFFIPSMTALRMMAMGTVDAT
ncbi:Dyp-type peroxidase [Primorskyibacter flagellatus]|uniref:Peroxidase n=1 Tax=Primorskyibacter flagellatus TaxID=1387277 RepID=A0A1W2A4R7_9RHOB|nr:peroxidase [Primorskyibacter flagellatus]SMC55675.1 hypothetical protein SAMN06295998_102409 [Primorskyibacter flagellatus]